MISAISVILFTFLSSKGENDSGYITTDSGLKYKITEKGDGEKAKVGQRVQVHYTGKLEDGTKFDSSYDRNEPLTFPLGEGRVIKGWDEGIALLQVGDKATLIIPPELGYGSRNIGNIPANSTLIFDLELIAILPEIKIEKFDVSGKTEIETDSGLKFILVKEGAGKKAAAGNTVTVHYTGYLKDGSSFDSSLKRDQPFSFVLGMGKVIKGWDEGVAMMKEGDRARLIIPYDLAYGEKGFPGTIPPKAELTFDIELLKVE